MSFHTETNSNSIEAHSRKRARIWTRFSIPLSTSLHSHTHTQTHAHTHTPHTYRLATCHSERLMIVIHFAHLADIMGDYFGSDQKSSSFMVLNQKFISHWLTPGKGYHLLQSVLISLLTRDPFLSHPQQCRITIIRKTSSGSLTRRGI